MKKISQILFFALATFIPSSFLFAQSQLSPCSAACLDAVGTSAQGRTPQKTLSINGCAMLPTDTSIWWVFRPQNSTFNFSYTTSGCTCPSGGVAGTAVTIYSGLDCSTLTKITCKTGVSNSFSLTGLTPCNLYWIQAGSTSTCQCNVKLTYGLNQLFKSVQPITINGPKVVCKGSPVTYDVTTSLPCLGDQIFRWSTNGAGSFSQTNNNTIKANLNITGSKKICVESNFAVCTGFIPKTCINVDVIDPKTPTENLTICPEDLPYILNVEELVKKYNPTIKQDITPASIVIKQTPGTTKNININYSILDASCNNQAKLTISVPLSKKQTLPSRLVADTEMPITIKGKKIVCEEIHPGIPLTINKDNQDVVNQCDTSFLIYLQCMRVKAAITPSVALLDCVNKSISLDASRSVTLPITATMNSPSNSTRTYLWSTGATTPQITVNQAGNYTVTVTYAVNWASPTGMTSRTMSAAFTATVIGSTNNQPNTPLPLTNKVVPCANDTVLYYQPTISGVNYTWSITNGTILGANKADSIRVKWGTNSPKKICVELNSTCGNGKSVCLDIQMGANTIAKTPKVIASQHITTNKMRYIVAKQTDVKHIWKVQNGILSNTIGDTATVTWFFPIGKKRLCVTAEAPCSSKDTCLVKDNFKPDYDGSTFRVQQTSTGLSPKDFLLTVFPNPAKERLQVSSNRSIVRYEIYDVAGRLLSQNVENEIDIASFAQGVYFIKAIDEQQAQKIVRFVKE